MLKLRDGNIGEKALVTTGAKEIIIHANIETHLEDDRSLDKNLEFLRDIAIMDETRPGLINNKCADAIKFQINITAIVGIQRHHQ